MCTLDQLHCARDAAVEMRAQRPRRVQAAVAAHQRTEAGQTRRSPRLGYAQHRTCIKLRLIVGRSANRRVTAQRAKSRMSSELALVLLFAFGLPARHAIACQRVRRSVAFQVLRLLLVCRAPPLRTHCARSAMRRVPAHSAPPCAPAVTSVCAQCRCEVRGVVRHFQPPVRVSLVRHRAPLAARAAARTSRQACRARRRARTAQAACRCRMPTPCAAHSFVRHIAQTSGAVGRSCLVRRVGRDNP